MSARARRYTEGARRVRFYAVERERFGGPMPRRSDALRAHVARRVAEQSAAIDAYFACVKADDSAEKAAMRRANARAWRAYYVLAGRTSGTGFSEGRADGATTATGVLVKPAETVMRPQSCERAS